MQPHVSERSHGSDGHGEVDMTLSPPPPLEKHPLVLAHRHLLHLLAALGGYLLLAASAERKQSRKMNGSEVILLTFPGKGTEVGE